MKTSEKELAAVVVQWLQEQKFEVYQEVLHYSKVADIVADFSGYGWIIECKTSLSLKLLEQAYLWKRLGVARVSIAVPCNTHGRREGYFQEVICRQFGIGLIYVNLDRNYKYVKEEIHPTFVRPPKDKQFHREILKNCTEQHKTFCAAGSARGGYLTPYKSTIQKVKNFLKGREATIKEIIEGIDHHYHNDKNGKASLLKRLIELESKNGWLTYELKKNKYYFKLRDDNEPTTDYGNEE